MYIQSVTRKFAPWFKQTIMTGTYKNKSISITSNFIDDELSFKSIQVVDADTFRECGKEPLHNKLHKLYDVIVQRKRK